MDIKKRFRRLMHVRVTSTDEIGVIVELKSRTARIVVDNSKLLEFTRPLLMIPLGQRDARPITYSGYWRRKEVLEILPNLSIEQLLTHPCMEVRDIAAKVASRAKR